MMTFSLSVSVNFIDESCAANLTKGLFCVGFEPSSSESEDELDDTSRPLFNASPLADSGDEDSYVSDPIKLEGLERILLILRLALDLN